MPLPERQHDEAREQFIDRCMADETMVREFPDAAQRRAVCEKQASAQAPRKPLAQGRWDGDADAPETVEMTASMQIEAAAPGDGAAALPRFSMIAYTGGAMRLGGWRYPVIVDLAGLAIPSQDQPIREGHETSRRVGHTQSVRIQDGKLLADGLISCTGQAAREVVADAKNGFPWKASIGASVEQFEFVREDQAVLVNGREFKGPANVVRKATLREISFVDLAADGNTSARVAATANGRTNMSDTEVKQDQAKVEAKADGAGTEAAPPVVDTAGDIREIGRAHV